MAENKQYKEKFGQLQSLLMTARRDIDSCNWLVNSGYNDCLNCQFNNSEDDEDDSTCTANKALWHLRKINQVLAG